MIKPQSTQSTQRKRTERWIIPMKRGFDIKSPEITIIKFAVRTSVLSLGLGINQD
jgi:hypothetical protein